MQQRARETRRSVLLAAAAVFERSGFAATRIQDILEEAEVTKGALYFHFESKEELAAAIVREQSNWREAYATDARWAVQQLIDLSFGFARALREDPLVSASVRLTLERNTFASQDPAPYDEWLDAVADLLVTAQHAGELKPDADPSALASVIVSAITGAQLVSEAKSGRRDLDERLEQFWRWLVPSFVQGRLVRKLELSGLRHDA